MTSVSEEVISAPPSEGDQMQMCISICLNICSLSAVTFICVGLPSSISSVQNTRNYWCIFPFILPRYTPPPRGAAEHPAQRAKHPTQVMKRNRAEEMNVTGKRQSPCRERGGGSFGRESRTVNVSDGGGGSGWVPCSSGRMQEQTVMRMFFLITVKLPQWGGAPGNDASLITASIVWFWSRQAVHVKCRDYFLIIKFAAVH